LNFHIYKQAKGKHLCASILGSAQCKKKCLWANQSGCFKKIKNWMQPPFFVAFWEGAVLIGPSQIVFETLGIPNRSTKAFPFAICPSLSPRPLFIYYNYSINSKNPM
jgi:hypothetical protein